MVLIVSTWDSLGSLVALLTFKYLFRFQDKKSYLDVVDNLCHFFPHVHHSFKIIGKNKKKEVPGHLITLEQSVPKEWYQFKSLASQKCLVHFRLNVINTQNPPFRSLLT